MEMIANRCPSALPRVHLSTFSKKFPDAMRVWTAKEKEQLHLLYPNHTLPQIALILNRPLLGVRSVIRSMKLTKKPQPASWSEAELAILRQHYAQTPLPTLAKMLGRTQAATNAKAKRMGLLLPDTKAQPLGTEKLQNGILRRKIAMSGPYQWRAVSLLEQSPEIRDLYRILSHIHKAARKTAE